MFHFNTMSVSKQQVVNLSSLKLSAAQTLLLSRGLSFCPTPGEPDMGKLKEDLDKFHMDLRRKIFFTNKRKLTLETNPPSSDSSDEDSLDEDELNPPFKHYEFKIRSTWNPPGPKVLEDFVFFNEECLRKHKVFALRNRNLSKDEYEAIKELGSKYCH